MSDTDSPPALTEEDVRVALALLRFACEKGLVDYSVYALLVGLDRMVAGAAAAQIVLQFYVEDRHRPKEQQRIKNIAELIREFRDRCGISPEMVDVFAARHFVPEYVDMKVRYDHEAADARHRKADSAYRAEQETIERRVRATVSRLLPLLHRRSGSAGAPDPT